MSLKQRGKGGQPSPLWRVLLLSLFFLCGIFAGQALAARGAVVVGGELTKYLRRYVTIDGSVSLRTVLSAILLYLRYPMVVALLGFSSIGIAIIPAITTALGFFLSFSVSCFAAVFGSDGVLLAAAVLGVRCLVMLPCYFLVAVYAWGSSAALASLSFGRGRRSASVSYGPRWWTRLLVCVFILMCGVCAELFCVPLFLQMVLRRIFL